MRPMSTDIGYGSTDISTVKKCKAKFGNTNVVKNFWDATHLKTGAL